MEFRVTKGLNYHCILGTNAHSILCHDYLKIPSLNQVKFNPSPDDIAEMRDENSKMFVVENGKITAG